MHAQFMLSVQHQRLFLTLYPCTVHFVCLFTLVSDAPMTQPLAPEQAARDPFSRASSAEHSTRLNNGNHGELSYVTTFILNKLLHYCIIEIIIRRCFSVR